MGSSDMTGEFKSTFLFSILVPPGDKRWQQPDYQLTSEPENGKLNALSQLEMSSSIRLLSQHLNHAKILMHFWAQSSFTKWLSVACLCSEETG